MIIDFHCHVFPDKIASKAIASLCKSGGTTPFLNGTVEDLRRSMRESGISYSVILPIATKPSQVVSINDFVISQHKKEGIISFGAIHPLYEHWEEELCRLKEAGIPGIKLHPDFQGLFVDDESMVVVMERAAELGMMILVHGGMDVSFPEVHRCTPERLNRILPRLEKKRGVLIAAHLGGYGYLDDVERLLVGRNLYLDLSFVLGRFPREQIVRILENHPADRLLFGTDSPWDGQKRMVEEVEGLPLSEERKRKLLYENGARLLGLL